MGEYDGAKNLPNGDACKLSVILQRRCWGESKDRRGVSGKEGSDLKERELGGCFCTRDGWEADPDEREPREEPGRASLCVLDCTEIRGCTRLALRFGVGGPDGMA